MSSLLERLHAKFNQNRPWSETIKLVRQVMVSIGKVLRITAQLYTTHVLEYHFQLCLKKLIKKYFVKKKIFIHLTSQLLPPLLVPFSFSSERVEPLTLAYQVSTGRGTTSL